MVDGWRPGRCSGFGDEARVGPETSLGTELDRVGWRGSDGELARPVEGDDRAIEPEVDLDQAPGIAPAAAPGRQLEGPPVEPDRVVASDLAAVLEDEDPVELDVRRDRPPARHWIGGRDGEPGVEAGQERGQQLVRPGPIGHAGQPELDDEPVLEGAHSRSIRPLAWGERATIEPIPSSTRARPTWLS